MYNRSKPFAVALILCMFVVALVPRPTTARFVIASWDYDDGYGQGIEVVYIHENSTGSWVAIKSPAFFLPSDDTVIDLNYTPNTALRVWPSVNINHSLLGLTVNTSILALIRISLEVSNAGTSVYSLENMTYAGGPIFDDTPTTWSVSYVEIIPILLTAGAIYTIKFTSYIYMP